MPRRGLAVLVLVTAVMAVAGCGSAAPEDSLLAEVEEESSLTIGTRFTQPGMSKRTVDGRLEGFDVDVARFVATELGVDPDDIRWRDLVAADRESAISGGKVDLVVGTYSITEERKEKVAFAGPYFETGQALLVRLTDKDITGPKALNGKKLCSVTGSTSAEQVKEEFAKAVELVEYPRYQECVTALLAGFVDAVTTDRAILAGHVAEHPELLKIVGEPFSEERYGIGLRKGDDDTRRALNAAIRKMIDSGRWRESVERHLGSADYEMPPPPEITED